MKQKLNKNLVNWFESDISDVDIYVSLDCLKFLFQELFDEVYICSQKTMDKQFNCIHNLLIIIRELVYKSLGVDSELYYLAHVYPEFAEFVEYLRILDCCVFNLKTHVSEYTRPYIESYLKDNLDYTEILYERLEKNKELLIKSKE